MVETENAAFNYAMGFLYRLHISLMKINHIRTNYDPSTWWMEMKVIETEIYPKLYIKENDFTIDKEDDYDVWWSKKYKEIMDGVDKALKVHDSLLHDDTPDEVQQSDIAKAKRETYEPLDKMHKHLLRLIWKKGWAMPEGEDWDTALLR